MTGSRWATDWAEDAPAGPDALGDHSAARFRHLRRVIEALDEARVDDVLFGLLLSAEGMRDEMRAFEEQPSALLRLAQTGHFVRQLRRLHGVLDAVGAQCGADEPAEMKEWEAALKHERSAHVQRYNALLASFNAKDAGDSGRGEEAVELLLADIETEEQQEEVLTLLVAAVDKYGGDVLTPEEVAVTTTAYQVVSRYSSLVLLTLPPWLVMPFEFSSTFGLSRWGNDVLAPEHSDKSRFIQEANVWSTLNHPHVVKFLGACHVGSRPFIVHERVRLLREYVGGKQDRQQVWRRLYEVALAMQYLDARGLGCGTLELDAVYCAELSDKAMLLGIGLDGVRKTHSNDTCADDTTTGTGLEDLVITALDCFSQLDSSDENQSKRQRRDASHDTVRSVPATRPEYVDDEEWSALMDIRQADAAASSAAMLRAIERFKELAGVEQGGDGFDDIMEALASEREQTDGLIKIESVELPGIKGRVIADALADCSDMIDAGHPCGHIATRLMDVYAQLGVMELQATDASANKLVAQFCNLVARLYRFVEQKSCSKATSVLGLSQREPTSLYSFHSDIDRLLATHNLSSSAAVHSWTLDAVLASQGMQETQPSTHGLHNYSERDALGFGSSQQPALERWFVPSHEVEFKSFAEFSRGAFGSVHHGRWFDTPVVVKSVFVDDSTREKTQAQFVKEADIWFQLNHINVVKMYGACHVNHPFFVCEYASGGDLSAYLEKKGREPYLIWYTLLNAALGLQYLHDKGIVHADLKADNVLIGADDVAKLTDFGLSVSTQRSDADGDGGALGAYRWKAPECLPSRGSPGQCATFASDVYSFAMVMIEVVSGSFPWGNSMPDAAVSFHVKKGRLPPRPSAMADAEWQLIERMCRLDPAERLTVDAVVVHLSSLLEHLDLARVWKVVDEIAESDKANAIVATNMLKNRVASRRDALLSLLELVKSSNAALASHASDHLLAVHVNRGMRTEKREIDILVQVLERGTETQKSWVVEAIMDLSWNSVDNSELIADAGAIPLLVALLRDGNSKQKDNAATTLMNLASYDDNAELIASAGAIPLLVALLCDGNDDQKMSAACALADLADSDDIKELIAASGGIDPLVELVRDGNDEQKEEATGTLWNIAGNYDNADAIVAAGAIPLVIALLRDGNDGQKANAAGVLEELSRSKRNIPEVTAAGAIPLLIPLLRDGIGEQKENAARALWSLAQDDANKTSIASAGAIPLLVVLLDSGNDDDKLEAARLLWELAVDADNKASIASAGAIPPLIALLSNGNEELEENAAGALGNMSTDAGNKALIASAGGIPALVQLLSHGSDESKEKATEALRNLAENDDNKALIASAGGIPPMVALLCNGNESQRELAASALWNLAQNPDNQALVASAGGIPPLVASLDNSTDVLKEKATGALWWVSVNAANRDLIASAGGIPLLIALIRDGNDIQKENALGILANMSVDAGNQDKIASSGAVPPLVALVRDGNDRLKENAAAALWALSTNKNNKVLITDADAIPPLMALARLGNDGQKAKAVGVLKELSGNATSKAVIAAAGGIPSTQ